MGADWERKIVHTGIKGRYEAVLESDGGGCWRVILRHYSEWFYAGTAGVCPQESIKDQYIGYGLRFQEARSIAGKWLQRGEKDPRVHPF